ncbi:DurN family substrate-assisted peptide maturase [Kineosporia succinea]|uniref:Uncharacterized protein n=1 Tax=Kineosporia succinea TaxID=84632 RepID=A0ABT9PEI0_9ACTN|nr:DurN family substrate-assisted peptide maturase [Kineosporia succinea]MDP9831112.1 hypothetical protein [Kineosporia succinea]
MKSAKVPTIYPGVDTIREVQELLVLASMLPSDGEMARALRLALDVPAETVTPRVNPVPDTHPHTMKGWLEEIWLGGHAGLAERHLLRFQGTSESMAAAMDELRAVERASGFRLAAEKV